MARLCGTASANDGVGEHGGRAMRSLVLAAMLIVVAAAAPAAGEALALKIAQQHGLPYLPLMVMQSEHLIESEARAAGLSGVTVTLVTLGGASAGMDTLLSGTTDIVAAGVPSVATLWAKTHGTANEIKGLAALESMPWYLVTRKPQVRTLQDFAADDRIALPAVKITAQALTLEMAAAQLYGDASYERLDPLTVQMDHPTAVAALLSGRSEITAHFGVPPYHWQELADPAIHTVLRSYDVVGGPHTVGVMITTKRFHDDNPKLVGALLAAQRRANALIKADPRKASEIYLLLTEDRTTPPATMARWIGDPEIVFTQVPQRVGLFVDFMYRVGRLTARPASWRALFFDEAHDFPGS